MCEGFQATEGIGTEVKIISILGRQYYPNIPEAIGSSGVTRLQILVPGFYFAAPPFGGSDGIPTRMSTLTGLPALVAGLKVHLLKANFASASISLERP